MGSGSPPPEAPFLRAAAVFPFAAGLRPEGRVLPLGREDAPFVLRAVVDGREAMLRRLGENHARHTCHTRNRRYPRGVDTRTIIVILAMTALGCGVATWLRSGTYRRPDEGGRLPAHWWVVPAAPVVGVLVARALADQPWPVLLPYLALVPAGLALAAIDADVHRLPNAITLPLVPIELVLLAGASAAIGDWDALRRAGLAALIVGGGFLALAFVLYGRSIGMGDAKLLVSLASALGWFSWTHVLMGLWLGFVIGGVVALVLLVTRRATKGTQLAFGPYLVAGALITLALT